jgi:hypothetical protein
MKAEGRLDRLALILQTAEDLEKMQKPSVASHHMETDFESKVAKAVENN